MAALLPSTNNEGKKPDRKGCHNTRRPEGQRDVTISSSYETVEFFFFHILHIFSAHFLVICVDVYDKDVCVKKLKASLDFHGS